MISDQINKDNLHHAYLIEGDRGVVVPEIIDFIEGLGIATAGNPDFCHISTDTFRIDDAHDLKTLGAEKGFTETKKIFVVSTNNILLEAQNSLLKVLEEPIENTHFFLVVPDAGSLLRTFVSRFYFVGRRQDVDSGADAVEKFLRMPLPSRINFVKNLVTESTKEAKDREADRAQDSPRAKATRFLDNLEQTLHHRQVSKGVFDTGVFHQIFQVRKFLRMPGSSTKTLLESVALVVPEF